MGLKEWADRRVRRRDVRAAIEETHFQMGMFQIVLATLRVAKSDKAALFNFDLSGYLAALISGLRESEARLFGFKGSPTEWTDSREMIKSGKVGWNEDRRERLILAAGQLEDFRSRLSEALAGLEAGRRTQEESWTAIESHIESFCASCANSCKKRENEALAAGLINNDQLAKIRRRAEKRVGAIVRGSMR